MTDLTSYSTPRKSLRCLYGKTARPLAPPRTPCPTHKTPEVKAWLSRHPRFKLHFTPTSASWLNLVEQFFAAITTRRIRRGSYSSVGNLETAIYDYLLQHNENLPCLPARIWAANLRRGGKRLGLGWHAGLAGRGTASGGGAGAA